MKQAKTGKDDTCFFLGGVGRDWVCTQKHPARTLCEYREIKQPPPWKTKNKNNLDLVGQGEDSYHGFHNWCYVAFWAAHVTICCFKKTCANLWTWDTHKEKSGGKCFAQSQNIWKCTLGGVDPSTVNPNEITWGIHWVSSLLVSVSKEVLSPESTKKNEEFKEARHGKEEVGTGSCKSQTAELVAQHPDISWEKNETGNLLTGRWISGSGIAHRLHW